MTESHTTLHDVCQEILRLEAVQKELLKALKEIVDQHGKFEHCLWAAHIARKAIAKAEEQA